MTTAIGVYEGFMLHLRVSLLAHDDTNHNEKMVESSIIEIIIEMNHAVLEDSCSQATESIVGSATNTRSFLLPLKRYRNAVRQTSTETSRMPSDRNHHK